MTLDHTQALRALPLQRLHIFWTTARHLNMVRAAADLRITQGAVSRQIKALEQSLDEQLFRRGPRGLMLTEAGDVLAEYVSRGFGEFTSGFVRIKQPRLRTTLMVSAPQTFALRVLAPRLGDFVRHHPWIDLRLRGHRFYADLERTGVDLSIRLGEGRWPGGRTVPLMPEQPLFPVCSPALLPAPREDRARTVDPVAFLRGKTLLHYAERPYWPNWLKAAGLDEAMAASGPSFDETALALASAEAGQGVAMARRVLVADALRNGSLVKIFEPELADHLGYYAVMTEAGAGRSTVQAFIDWVQALAASYEAGFD